MSFVVDDPDKLQRTGTDAHLRYLGKYTGYVRDNLDPERRGRVRVYCPEVMGEVDNPSKWLGWAETSAPGSGFDQGLFFVPTMPEDNPRDLDDPTSPFNQSRVWMSFRDGDPAKPLYEMGGNWVGGELILNHVPVLSDVDNAGDESIATPNGVASSVKFEANYETGELVEGLTVDEPVSSNEAAYPRNMVWKSSGGSIFEIDDSPGAERIKVFHPAGSFFEMNQTGSFIQRVTGKKVEYISDDSFCSIRGPSVQVMQSTQHLQVDRSSVNIYRDSRMVVTQKAEKRFNRAGLELEVAGALSQNVANYSLGSTGNATIVAADEIGLGARQINVQGVTTQIMGTEKTEIIGFISGVKLIGANRALQHKIYASDDINTLLGVIVSTLDGLTSTLVGVLTPIALGGGPAPAGAVLTWVEGVQQAMNALQAAFENNLTVHTATKV